MALDSRLESGEGQALFERMGTHGYVKSCLPYYTMDIGSARRFRGMGRVSNGPLFADDGL